MLRVAEIEQEIKAEQELSQKLSPYAGKWVVISRHDVVASGATPSEAREKAPAEFDRIFRVPRTTGSALL
jgi:Asp-tRNA(Asn)/Glu-tRNA(Gln) amidotransferase C subunit